MKLFVNPDKIIGKIKPMNAVNNGPVYTENADQNLTICPILRKLTYPMPELTIPLSATTTAGSTRLT